jgi:hypothetical protein
MFGPRRRMAAIAESVREYFFRLYVAHLVEHMEPRWPLQICVCAGELQRPLSALEIDLRMQSRCHHDPPIGWPRLDDDRCACFYRGHKATELLIALCLQRNASSARRRSQMVTSDERLKAQRYQQ